MKTLVHIVAALMFVIGSAGFAQADEHHADTPLVSCIECEQLFVDLDPDVDGKQSSSIHCGSPVLCTSCAPTINVASVAEIIEHSFVEIGISIVTPADLRPPRS